MMRSAWILGCVLTCIGSVLGDEGLSVRHDHRQVILSSDSVPIATYVFDDDQTTRPYFKDVQTLFGRRVTRHHPPQAGDSQDHAHMHPGLWLAFGDLNGFDSWRLKAPVVHREFAVEPHRDAAGRIVWETVSDYREGPQGETMATEHTRFSAERRESDWRLNWNSQLRGLDRPLVFGDQEEMGLGVRMATELAVNAGGRIRNSYGDLNEEGCWGKRAAWCDYGAERDGRRYGILLRPSSTNFKPSTFHVRDYGLMLANPFAEKAFGRSVEPVRVEIPAAGSLQLSFEILIYDRPASSEAPLP